MLGVVVAGAVGHLDDQPAGLADQQRQREVAGDQVRVDRQAQHPQPLLEVVLPHRRVPLEQQLAAPDVVDQHVEPPAARRRSAATSASTWPASRWSTATAIPVPPAALTSSAVSSIVSGRSYSERRSRVLRPVQYTVAPASPSATAVPRPAPRVAPGDERDLAVERSDHAVSCLESGDRIPAASGRRAPPRGPALRRRAARDRAIRRTRRTPARR